MSKLGEDLFELAALYALDALRGPEREAFELELARSPELRHETDRLRDVAGAIGAAPDPAEPPAGLGDRILDAARAKPGVLLEDEGLLIVRSEDLPWQRLPLEGISVRPLHVDASSGAASSIVEMRKGSVYPGHRHAADEELFVLKGKLLVHGVAMGPGDYCRANADTEHQPAKALEDCIMLVRNSLHDEVQ